MSSLDVGLSALNSMFYILFGHRTERIALCVFCLLWTSDSALGLLCFGRRTQRSVFYVIISLEVGLSTSFDVLVGLSALSSMFYVPETNIISLRNCC
jgi:hypothetical protein